MKLNTQRTKVLELIKNAGSAGISSYALTYQHNVKQAPTRVHELKQRGHNIISKRYGRTVKYVYSEGLQVTTESKILASNQPNPIIQPWEKQYERYQGKDGRWYSREL
jgi:hypothetical protein